MAKKQSQKLKVKPFVLRDGDTLLDHANRFPLYHQLYLILRSKILDGEFEPQDYIPGERELEALFDVSRITAVRALNELANDGLVVRERGRGTRVQFVGQGVIKRGPASTRGINEPPTGRSHEVFQDLMTKGRGAAATVYDFDYIEAPAEVAEALELSKGNIVQHAVRVWRFEKSPFNHVITYVPEDIGRLWTKKDLQKKPLHDLLKENGYRTASVRERITATLADVVLSQRLETATGSPLLRIKRTSFDGKGRPIEYLVGSYPPDRYQYEVSLPKPKRKR